MRCVGRLGQDGRVKPFAMPFAALEEADRMRGKVEQAFSQLVPRGGGCAGSAQAIGRTACLRNRRLAASDAAADEARLCQAERRNSEEVHRCCNDGSAKKIQAERRRGGNALVVREPAKKAAQDDRAAWADESVSNPSPTDFRDQSAGS